MLRKHSINVDNAVAQYQLEQQGSPGTIAQGSNATTAQFDELCATFEGTLSLDESVNFDRDGECHYFGPTSGRLHFQHCKFHSEPHTFLNLTFAVQPTSHGNRDCPHISHRSLSETLNNSDYSSTPSTSSQSHIDADLQAELINLYFIWQNPWFPVLDESLFRKDLSKGTGRYFSPLLMKCVLSAGSRFSERSEVRADPLDPNTAGDCLLKDAEALLHHELLSPSLTTIQAAGIMIYLYVVSITDSATTCVAYTLNMMSTSR